MWTLSAAHCTPPPRCTARLADVWCTRVSLPNLAIHEQSAAAGRRARGWERKQENPNVFHETQSCARLSSAPPPLSPPPLFEKPGRSRPKSGIIIPNIPGMPPGNAARKSLDTPFSTREQYYKATAPLPAGGGSTVLIGYCDYHTVTKLPKIGCCDYSQMSF